MPFGIAKIFLVMPENRKLQYSTEQNKLGQSICTLCVRKKQPPLVMPVISPNIIRCLECLPALTALSSNIDLQHGVPRTILAAVSNTNV